EDAAEVGGLHADAVIAHHHAGQRAAPDDAGLDGGVGGELHGVRQEVREDLVDAEAVPGADDRTGGAELHGAAGAQGVALEAGADFAHQIDEIELGPPEVDAPEANARDVEQAVDEVREPL